ncbi:MAG: VOC family protein, partial [Mycobacteriales bacterium]
ADGARVVAATTLRFHHFGLATRDLEKSAQFLAASGFRVGPTIFDPEQSVDLAFAEHPLMPAVELISPRPGVPGPVDRLLAAQATAIYHLGYQCRSIEQSLTELRQAGSRVLQVSPPKPAVLFGGVHVAFVQVRDFGLVELIEEAVR